MKLSVIIPDGFVDLCQRAVIALEKIAENTTPRPMTPRGQLNFYLIGESAMGLIYKVDLPTFAADDPAAADIQRGELRLSVNGEARDPITTAKDQTTIDRLELPQDADVEAKFVFVDDAGNVSLNPVSVAFRTVDTVPPPDAVGGLAFQPVGEE